VVATVEVPAGVEVLGAGFWRLPLRGMAEATTLLWVYAVYGALRNFATGSPTLAARHAIQVLHLERPLGIDLGQRIRDATQDQRWVISVANVVYASHALVPVVVLVALYRYRPHAYVRWRNTFVVILAIGLIGFWLYPLMPPDILAGSYHFVDTTRTLSVGHTPLPGAVIPNRNRFDVLGFSNPYAAMPSLHVAWALFASLAAWSLITRRWLRYSLLVYPILMSGVVVITGNHWILDAVAGYLTVAIAYAIARCIEGLRNPPRHATQKSLATGPPDATSSSCAQQVA
jgi:hypothetical protein